MLSNIGGFPGEGQKKVAMHLDAQLAKRHDVWHSNARQSASSPGFWAALARFRPNVIHIFLRPNVSTFLFAWALKTMNKGAKTVVSALQPPRNIAAWNMVAPLLKPDLVLTLSEATDRLFHRIGCKTAFLGCGVDTERFSPGGTNAKLSLREEYGIEASKFVVLHVGHVTKGRNLLPLAGLQQTEEQQILLLHSPVFRSDPGVYQCLKESGCILLGDYLENVEHVYQLADCYFFPTLDSSSCIELPLSVLEAMSCNLPVITTRFGALVKLFHQGDGLFYFENIGEAHIALELIKRKEIPVKTRERVTGYTWHRIAHELEKIYSQLIGEV